MSKVQITCIECPMGCAIEVELSGGKVASVTGNGCPRGKLYAENEVTCPKRVVTSTVRLTNGKVVSVKTDAPVEKAKIFEVMAKINAIHPEGEVQVGDILLEKIEGEANLVAADNSIYL